MSRTPDARARDTQTKQIQENITNVEKHFGDLCQLFSAYVRKTARLRDKADLLVKEVGLYADTETPNLKLGLKNFADQLAKIQDYRQAEVERLEVKVIEPLTAYGNIVKTKRAESELQRATMDATRTTRQLEETIDDFEKQKIRDIKKILGEFVTVEMTFHAKALEIYTTAYQHIQNVDEEGDLEVFRNSLHPTDYQSGLEVVRANSKLSLNRTGTSMSKSGTMQSRTSSRQRKRDDEEDEDEEEDDEDEDDLEEVTDDEH
ncbi:CBY1-interacting BAR domain-containing protein 1-like isoform X1 [Carassius carassius]|uniref:CBY1-interacting BAR domain-containing protein 1-like isoform X1 n=1 Tax=Carassius carassius TaxID=217509 RepID=UPI002868CA24|nr:CBY1-interacting BAR domain-containing protein 1-like isoform X1 [Carassius carassius]